MTKYCNSAVSDPVLTHRQANTESKNFDPPSVHSCAFTASRDFNCEGNVSGLAAYGVKRMETGIFVAPQGFLSFNDGAGN
jgi:hypothetical protein